MALTLHDRLCLVIGHRSHREIAELTGWSAETVRRYVSGHMPSSEFIADICRLTGTNAQWLITGQGPRTMDEARAAALDRSTLADLVVSLCQRIEELAQRVERLEAERRSSPAPEKSDDAKTSDHVVVPRRRR